MLDYLVTKIIMLVKQIIINKLNAQKTNRNMFNSPNEVCEVPVQKGLELAGHDISNEQGQL